MKPQDLWGDIQAFRRKTENYYVMNPQRYWFGGEFRSGDFGEILCFEIHATADNPRAPKEGGVTFKELAKKWNISLPFLGELIADHCWALAGLERNE